MVNFHESYLELSIIFDKNKKRTLKKVKERVWNKLNSCKKKSLSKASKKVPIKSVI